MTTQKRGTEWRYGFVLAALVITAFMLVSSAAAADTSAKFKGFGGTGPYPAANFTADVTSGSAPLTVQFFDNSTSVGSSIISRTWDFGVYGTSTAANPVITFTNPGTYTVGLRVENATGWTSNVSGEHPIDNSGYTLPSIEVNPASGPKASFTVDPASGSIPVGYPAQFTNTSTGNPTTFLWNFGDGQTSALKDPVHTYSTSGTFSVTLTVTGAGGTNSVTDSVEVIAATAPVADFTGTPETGVAPLNVSFTDISTNLPTSWAWEFGDGTTSTLQDPYHIFTLPGSYIVNLTATNAAGSDTESHTVVVTGPQAPISNFTANGENAANVAPIPTLSGNAPFSVEFVDNSNTAADRKATSWLWTFGDGQTSTQRNVTHVYATPGTYPVQFTATNSGGSNSSFITISVGATAVPAANFQFNTTDSAADGALFSAPDMLVTGKTVWFNSTSTNAPTTTSWTFSDGVTSSATNFSRTFSSAGDYWVLLSVSNSAGSSSKINFFKVTSAVIGAAPVASFGMESQGTSKINGETLTVTLPAVVNFTNTSTNNPTAWTWFVDGTQFSTEKNASYSFNTAGTYPIQLIVSNSNGTSSASGTVVVSAPSGAPTAAFSYTPTEAQAAPATIQFKDESTGFPTAWAWNFDDGQTSTLQNPSHIFSAPGNYTVRLTATNGAGSAQVSHLIEVKTLQPPVASFTAVSGSTSKTSADAEIQGAIPFTVNFTSTSTMNPTSFLWQITGTGVSFTRNTNTFNYTFETPGKYSVQLIAYNAAGNNAIYKSAYVNVTASAPVSDFTWAPTAPTKNQPVQFTDTTLYGPTVWAWSFGDGGLSSAQNPSHTYTTPGAKTVTLTTWNSQGSNTTSKVVVVADITAPVANFTWSPENPTVGDLVTFTDSSTNSPTAWTWVIENTQYNTQNPSVTFTTPGVKIAFLIASNAAGSSAAKLVQINVADAPVTVTPTPDVPIVAGFTVDTESGVAPLDVQFVSTSTGPYDSLDWTILVGDDVIDTMIGETPSFTFNTPNTYTVLLEASNSVSGEVATAEKTITVTAVEPTTTVTTVTTTPTQTAIGGNQPYPSAHNLPGIVQAEDYDVTAGYPAYSDTTLANEGGAYRNDAVDIEAGASGYNVGWIRAGEFLTYSVDTAAAGTFNVNFRIANPSAAKTVTVYINGAAQTLTIPSTGSFGNWQMATLTGVSLNAGRNLVKVDMGSAASFNFDYMDFQSSTPVTTTTTVVTTTTTAQPTTGGANFVAVPTTAKKGSAVKFTVTPATGKTIKSVWWTFDATAHMNTWNSRTINPTFYYPAVGTFSPLVKITYTDNSVEEIKKTGYVKIT